MVQPLRFGLLGVNVDSGLPNRREYADAQKTPANRRRIEAAPTFFLSRHQAGKTWRHGRNPL